MPSLAVFQIYPGIENYRNNWKHPNAIICSLSALVPLSLIDKVCQWLATDRWFSPGTPISSTNKTDRYDILLRVMLNTINQPVYRISTYWLYIFYHNICLSLFRYKHNVGQWDCIRYIQTTVRR